MQHILYSSDVTCSYFYYDFQQDVEIILESYQIHHLV
jgi:hypothetical protein